MRSNLGDEARLRHILDAISEIQLYLKNTDLEEFARNSMKKYATVKQLESLGRRLIMFPEEQKINNQKLSGEQL